MAENVAFEASPRPAVGTKAARKLREAGKLPAVVYGHGEGVAAVALDQHEVIVALSHGVRTADVNIDGHAQRCLIKDVQYDSWGVEPIHMDLARVDIHERVKVTVGIELRGTPKGVDRGGLLDLHMAAIDVECLVSDIPDTLRPNVTKLELGEALFVRDLVLPEGVVAMADDDERICTVHEPAKVDEEEEAAEPETEGEAEPERIGRVRKDEEESGS